MVRNINTNTLKTPYRGLGEGGKGGQRVSPRLKSEISERQEQNQCHVQILDFYIKKTSLPGASGQQFNSSHQTKI